MAKITKETYESATSLIEEYEEIKQRYYSSVSPIESRCDEIINEIAKIYNKTNISWHYDNVDDENEDGGEFDFEEYEDTVGYNIYNFCGEFECDLKDGKWDLSTGFPTRFLFEDFEKEVEDGRMKAKERLLKRKEADKLKRLEKKENKSKIAAIAKEKVKGILSKEELKCLSIKMK